MTPYAVLTDEQILDLGAALENELAEIHGAQAHIRQLPTPQFPLKAGLKLGINSAVFAAGVALAPITLNISLGLAAIGFGMNLWDGMEFSRQVSAFLAMQRQSRNLGNRAAEIETALGEISATLTSRLTPR